MATKMSAEHVMNLGLGASSSPESVELTATAHHHLCEAIDLVGAEDAREIVELALRELCERQRFRAWVANLEG